MAKLLGLVLLLAVAMGAQGRSGRAHDVQVPAARSEAGPEETGAQAAAQTLFATARAAVVALPALAAPVETADLARDEMRILPARSLADYTTAFWLARALPLPASFGAGDDPASTAVEAIKERVELAAVQALARPRRQAGAAGEDDDAAALQLARSADVPKAPLYDPLLSRAGQRGDAAAVMALGQECVHSGGTYPYRGLGAALRSSRLSGGERVLLAQAGLSAWYAGATPGEGADALLFLRAVQRATPAFTPEVNAVLQGILGSSADPGTRARATALLRTPESGAASPPLEFANDSAGGAPMLSFSVTTTAPVDRGSGDAVGASAFVLLVNRAQMLARSAPGGAMDVANQASDMLDASLLATVPDTAATLASVYTELGAAADAARVLSLCLDAADQLGAAADQTYANAGAAARAAFVQHIQTRAASVIDVYSLAARLDPPTTINHAEASNMVLFKPLVLSRLAVLTQFPSAGSAR